MRILNGLSVDGYGVLVTDDINFLDRNVHILSNSQRDEIDNERHEFLFCPKTCNFFSKMQVRPYSFETSNNTIVNKITLAELNYWNQNCQSDDGEIYLIVSNSCNATARIPISQLCRTETPVLREKTYSDDELRRILASTFQKGLEFQETLKGKKWKNQQ